MMQTGTGRRLSYADSVEAVLREGLNLAVREADQPVGGAGRDPGELLNGRTRPPSGWHHLCDDLEADRQREIRTATEALESELRDARRTIQFLERKTLRARLSRMSAKIRRHLGLSVQSPAIGASDSRKAA
jgi:hypothetical protein